VRTGTGTDVPQQPHHEHEPRATGTQNTPTPRALKAELVQQLFLTVHSLSTPPLIPSSLPLSLSPFFPSIDSVLSTRSLPLSQLVKLIHYPTAHVSTAVLQFYSQLSVPREQYHCPNCPGNILPFQRRQCPNPIRNNWLHIVPKLRDKLSNAYLRVSLA